MGESSTNLRNAIPNRWQRSAQYLRRILAAYWPLLRSQFAQHDCLTAAAALTFTSLLALVPLMTVTYIGLSLVPQYGDLWVEVQNFIFRNFVPASSELVQQKLTEFAGRARGLTTAGGIGIVSVALLMLVSIEKRFNAIWQVATPRWGVQRVPEQSHRSKKRALPPQRASRSVSARILAKKKEHTQTSPRARRRRAKSSKP